MDSEEFLLKRLEIIEPLLHIHPLPWEAVKKQAVKAGRSPRTIYRWLKTYREQGVDGFKPNEKKGMVCPHEYWIPFIRKHYLSPKRLSVAFVHGLCLQKSKENGITLPSYSTVYRTVKHIPKSVTCYHRDIKTYKNKYQVIGQLSPAMFPGDVFLIDHRKLDLLILESDRLKPKAKRPWITCVLDQYSRALVGYYLGFENPSSRRVALALRHAILPKNDYNWPMCGIPAKIKHDHGKDLVSKHIQQVRLDLKIEAIPKEIENPKGNAIIERFFGTMAMWENQFDGWVGNSLANRPEVVNPSLNLKQLNSLFYEFIRDYHQKNHSTLRMSPSERWNQGALQRLPESEKALDLMLMPVARSYKIRRDGIHFRTNRYWGDELLQFIGETAIIRYDPLRLDEIIVYIGKKRVGTATNLTAKPPPDYMSFKRRRSEQTKIMKQQVPGKSRSKMGVLPKNKSESKDKINKLSKYFKKDPENDQDSVDCINPLPIKEDEDSWC